MGEGFFVVIRRRPEPEEPPVDPDALNFNFNPSIYEPPEGDDVDFIFTT